MDACAGNVTDVCKIGQELLMSVRNFSQCVCFGKGNDLTDEISTADQGTDDNIERHLSDDLQHCYTCTLSLQVNTSFVHRYFRVSMIRACTMTDVTGNN